MSSPPAVSYPDAAGQGLAGPCYVPDNLHNFYVAPQRKLLVCATEKVGLQMFADLTCSLAKQHAPSDAPRVVKAAGSLWEQGCGWYAAQACNSKRLQMNATSLQAVLADPAWSRAVFYRDPLERFLSGYRSKCESGHDPDRWICDTVFGSYNASFDHAVAVASAWNNRRALPPGKAFDHFRPQSDMCMGTLTQPGDFYSSVAELDPESDTTREGVQSWLRSSGVDPESEPAFRRHFPRRARAEPSVSTLVQGDHATHAERTRTLYYRRPEHVREILRFYLPDYKAFELTLPRWAVEMLAPDPANEPLLRSVGALREATDESEAFEREDSSGPVISSEDSEDTASAFERERAARGDAALQATQRVLLPRSEAEPSEQPNCPRWCQSPAPNKATGLVVAWSERCAWRQTNCSQCEACVALRQQQEAPQEAPQEPPRPSGSNATAATARTALAAELPPTLLLQERNALPHVTTPPKNGTCFDVVQREAAMQVFGVHSLARCEDLRPELGACSSYVASEPDGTRRLCAAPSQADSGCSSGPAFACGDAEHLEAKARLDELLPMFE